MFMGVKISKTKTGVTDIILSRGFPQSARDTQVWNYNFFGEKNLSLIHYFHIDHNAPCLTLPASPRQKHMKNHCLRFL